MLTPEQRFARDQLEAELESLRVRKSYFDEDRYYEQLEAILLKLGSIYLKDTRDS